MKSLHVALASAVFALFASQAIAQVTFDKPMDFTGTGCPAPNTYSFSGPGTNTLTVLFNKYDAAKPREKAISKMETTACSFVVPVIVPPGYQVSLMTADWRGFTEGKTELFREYFIAGQRGPRLISTPPKPSPYFLAGDNLLVSSWSKCGAGKVPMRINSRVRAISPPSYIAVDSVDVHSGKVLFKLNWRTCR